MGKSRKLKADLFSSTFFFFLDIWVPFGKYEGKRKIREYGMTRKKYSKYFSDIIKYEESIQKNDNSDKLFSSH